MISVMPRFWMKNGRKPGREREKQMNKNSLMMKYSILQGAYWMMFCAIYAFSTVFLMERGFHGTQIGLITALGNILGVILQPAFAALADRSQKFTVHRLTILLAALLLAVLVLLCAASKGLIRTALFFMTADALLQSLQPLVNSLSVYYINRGVAVNFGVARGIGSVLYAVGASVFGRLIVAAQSSDVILIAGILLLALIIVTVRGMPVQKETGGAGRETLGAPKKSGSAIRFLMRYRYFPLVLGGLTLLLMNHNMQNNYLIQITAPLGGDSAAMGNALAIAAVLELPTMFAFSRMVKKISCSRLLTVSGIFFFLKALGYFFAGNMTQMYLAQIFQIGAFALYIPASVYYVNEVMEEQDKFKGQALMVGTSTLGGVFGGLAGGVMIDHFDIRCLTMLGVVLTFFGMALVSWAAPRALKAGTMDDSPSCTQERIHVK